MRVLDHIHTYRRVGNSKLFGCYHPQCSHSASREFLVNKEAICYSCGQKYKLTKEALSLKFPHCIECTKPYKDDSRSALAKARFLKTKELSKNLEEVINFEEIAKESIDLDPSNNSNTKRGTYEI